MQSAEASEDMYAGRDPTEVPAYSFPDAARILRVPASTVRAWSLGQGRRDERGLRPFEPVILMDDPEARFLSFRNLVELHVLTAIRRQYGISLQNTRRGLQFLSRLRDQVGGSHPLATQRMLTDGQDLIIREGSQILNVSRSGQLEMGIVSAFLKRIEFDQQGNLARLYPFTTSSMEDARSIVIDPRLQFGRPCLAGKGIPTEELVDRFHAGEAIEELSADYEVEARLIEAAIRFEQLRAA